MKGYFFNEGHMIEDDRLLSLTRRYGLPMSSFKTNAKVLVNIYNAESGSLIASMISDTGVDIKVKEGEQ